jgi:hypothetical protein
LAAVQIERELRMKRNAMLTYRCARICLGILLFPGIAVAAWPQTAPDFSGIWKQDNDRCLPKRSGDVMLRTDHHDPELTIETSISHDSVNSRHAIQKYTTDGRAAISTGADGDEFHTVVAWKGSSLVFSIEEHEGSRILFSTETWSLVENGTTLQRIRERLNGEKQTLFYQRQQRASK